MKKIILVALLSLVIFGGCSSKEPVISEVNKNIEKTYVIEEKVLDTNVSENNINSTNLLTTMASFDNIYFDFDKYSLNESMEDEFNFNLKLVKEMNEDSEILLEGNSDERGTDEYNFALSLKRAQFIKNKLIAEGISENKINVISYGETNPSCSNHNIDCWKENRKVVFKILK